MTGKKHITMETATTTDEDMIFNGQNQEQEQEESKAKMPLFSSDRGAAWIKQDKNDDYYLSVQVNLGILGSHSLNLFCDDNLKQTFNKFCSHAEDQDLAKKGVSDE